MKIKRSDLEKLIQTNLMNEIVSLSTGGTNYETVDYEKCDIKIPQIFKDVFLNTFYDGITPREVRSAMSQHFEESNPRSNKEKAARIAAVFNDDVINNITSLLTSFANIAGVPAVVCNFLQLAINEFEDLFKTYVDLDKDEDNKLGDNVLPFAIKNLKDALTIAMSRIETDSNGINTDIIFIDPAVPMQNNPEYNSILLLICGGELFETLPPKAGAMKLQDDDREFFAKLKQIDNTFMDFQDEMNRLYSRLDKNSTYIRIASDMTSIISENLISNNLSSEQSSVESAIQNALTDTKLIESLEKNDAEASEEKAVVNKKKYVKSCIQLFEYIYSMCYYHLINVIPRRSGTNDIQIYYENNPNFYTLLRQLAPKYLR
jgi:hypothetical protein